MNRRCSATSVLSGNRCSRDVSIGRTILRNLPGRARSVPHGPAAHDARPHHQGDRRATANRWKSIEALNGIPFLSMEPVSMEPVRDALSAALGDRYTIERVLGRGGMATVYLARDLRHSRPVAIKVLRPELSLGVMGERFLSEIQIAAGLTHPNLLPVFDSGGGGDCLYYVMPYVEGESLRARMD